MKAHSLLHFSEEVADALHAKRPLLALESTIISHGMPYPDNLENARELEAIVRSKGVVPATVAVFDGKIHIGLSAERLEQLATQKVMKLSRRDLAYAIQQRVTGATTVSTTMIGAHLAGIRVFATGGIGGVHRGAELSFDVSADLTELARTPVAVVCAGAKAILDLPKTMEVLETYGVPVIGYKTNELPSFYSRSSGIMLEMSAHSPDAIAQLLKSSDALGLQSGTLIVNPVPAEDEIPTDEMEKYIHKALIMSRDRGAVGKEVTPFLLKQVAELTAGRSLRANKALVRNNVVLGADVAAAYTSAE